MKKKTKILLSTVASAMVLTTSMMAYSTASAADLTHQSLVDEIATKFNLNKADVQAVFDTHKQEVTAAHQQKIDEALNQAVTDGQLTSAQKQLILSEQATVATRLAAIAKLTDKTARQAAVKQLQSDIQAWAKTNNIDNKWLRDLGAPGPGHGEHKTGSYPVAK